jgi:hypothetical protein
MPWLVVIDSCYLQRSLVQTVADQQGFAIFSKKTDLDPPLFQRGFFVCDCWYFDSPLDAVEGSYWDRSESDLTYG